MSADGWNNLANAIILQAVKDFKPAFRRLRKHPNDKMAQNQVRELTKFFCSDWFGVLTGLDGPALLNRIMRAIDEKGKP